MLSTTVVIADQTMSLKAPAITVAGMQISPLNNTQVDNAFTLAPTSIGYTVSAQLCAVSWLADDVSVVGTTLQVGQPAI